jgi:hypothetical protein
MIRGKNFLEDRPEAFDLRLSLFSEFDGTFLWAGE